MESIIRTDKIPGRIRNRPVKNYAGNKFGRLTAVEMVERDCGKWGSHRWRFHCGCGGETIASIRQVRSGKTSSCGCIATEVLVARNTKHSGVKQNPREYRSWKDMRSRCNNPNNTDYRLYGERGIKVCRRWDDFGAFLKDMGPRPIGYTLDRIDVNGHYEPGNCRWATSKTQANNKRTNHAIEYNGSRKTLQQWCDEFALEPSKVRYRLSVGMSLDDAFSKGDLRRDNC